MTENSHEDVKKPFGRVFVKHCVCIILNNMLTSGYYYYFIIITPSALYT